MTRPTIPLSRRLRLLGALFTPSRGPIGLCVSMSNGKEHQFYIYTPWGMRRVCPESGMSMIYRQRAGRYVRGFTLALAAIALLLILI